MQPAVSASFARTLGCALMPGGAGGRAVCLSARMDSHTSLNLAFHPVGTASPTTKPDTPVLRRLTPRPDPTPGRGRTPRQPPVERTVLHPIPKPPLPRHTDGRRSVLFVDSINGGGRVKDRFAQWCGMTRCPLTTALSSVSPTTAALCESVDPFGKRLGRDRTRSRLFGIRTAAVPPPPLDRHPHTPTLST
jgi:hypothetical protein